MLDLLPTLTSDIISIGRGIFFMGKIILYLNLPPPQFSDTSVSFRVCVCVCVASPVLHIYAVYYTPVRHVLQTFCILSADQHKLTF